MEDVHPNQVEEEGAYGQDRKTATIPWLWKRQGIHALMSGGITAGALGIPSLLAVASVSEIIVLGVFIGLGFVGLAFALVFIAYEIRESVKINDWAWPDLAGWKQGVPVGVAVGLASLLLL